MFNSRSEADETLLAHMRALPGTSRERSAALGEDMKSRVVVCDARPFVNAVGHKGKGGGFENISRYDAETATAMQPATCTTLTGRDDNG